MRQDAVTYLLGEVEALGHQQGLLVVSEASVEPFAQCVIERVFAGVPERRMPRIVAEAHGLHEVLVQP